MKHRYICTKQVLWGTLNTNTGDTRCWVLVIPSSSVLLILHWLMQITDNMKRKPVPVNGVSTNKHCSDDFNCDLKEKSLIGRGKIIEEVGQEGKGGVCVCVWGGGGRSGISDFYCASR